MSRVGLGVVLGIVAGLVSVASMLPMTFPDKRTALAGAFVSRFLIGLFSATVMLPLHPVASGGLIGLLVSLPDAIITKAYVPILVLGVILGLLCGGAVLLWAP